MRRITHDTWRQEIHNHSDSLTIEISKNEFTEKYDVWAISKESHKCVGTGINTIENAVELSNVYLDKLGFKKLIKLEV